MFSRGTIFGILVLVVAIGPALAQSSAQRVESRQKIEEMMAEPNIARRVANLEEIVAEGNRANPEFAIRLAMTGTQAEMRRVAFRSYMGMTKRIVLDIERRGGEESGRRRGRNARESMNEYAIVTAPRMGPVLTISVLGVDQNTGLARVRTSFYDREDVEATITGDRLIVPLRKWLVPGGGSYGGMPCHAELRPDNNLQLVGALDCGGNNRLRLVGPLF